LRIVLDMNKSFLFYNLVFHLCTQILSTSLILMTTILPIDPCSDLIYYTHTHMYVCMYVFLRRKKLAKFTQCLRSIKIFDIYVCVCVRRHLDTIYKRLCPFIEYILLSFFCISFLSYLITLAYIYFYYYYYYLYITLPSPLEILCLQSDLG
jgi:hypothetical protein